MSRFFILKIEENCSKAIFSMKWESSMRVTVRLLYRNAVLKPLTARNKK